MENNRLKLQVALMRQSLFDQGYLEGQFDQLELLQDDEEPNFAEELVNLFFNESSQWITGIEHALEKSTIDFSEIDGYASKFKDNSSSIGAKRVSQLSLNLMDLSEAQNADGCKKAVEELKMECELLKEKLQSYFHLAKQTGHGSGASSSK